MNTIWIVGAMGTGKTSVGRAAASRIGVPFHDTDRLVEIEARLRVAEIWEQEGEEGFRRREAEAIGAIASEYGVVATGGGAVLDPANRKAMTGTVVWLRAKPETIAGRLRSGDGRPMLGDGRVEERIRAILAERSPMYEQVATHHVDTDQMTVGEVAREVARLWPS